MSGFRNILVHNYLGDIDPVTIKSVIEEHLYPLELVMHKMLDGSA
ncbi:HepT-like ribonuclease domain-containing protein [Marinomonas sp. RS-M-Aa-14]